MRQSRIAVTAFAALCCGGLGHDAMAADRGASFNWSGFYVGAQVGQSWATADTAFVWPFNGRTYSTSNELDRVIGGAYAGMNVQTPSNFVFGIEADVTFGDAADRDSPYYENGVLYPGVTGFASSDWSVGGRTRIGYAMDRFMPYVAVGVAAGNVKVGYLQPLDNHGHDTMLGITLGAGLEYALTRNMIARFDYKYADFNGKTTIVGNNPPTPTKIDLDRHDLMFGLAYKF